MTEEHLQSFIESMKTKQDKNDKKRAKSKYINDTR